MCTFEELHPDLNPSPICGQVNSYKEDHLVNGKSVMTEWWERNPVTGKMINVLKEKELEAKIAKLKKMLEEMDNEEQN